MDIVTRAVSPVSVGNVSNTDNRLGSECSGTNMTAGRILTLNNTKLTSNEKVYLNGLRLMFTSQYTITNAATGSTITFVPIIRDDSRIVVDYLA